MKQQEETQKKFLQPPNSIRPGIALARMDGTRKRLGQCNQNAVDAIANLIQLPPYMKK